MHRVNILAKIAFNTSEMTVFLYQSNTIWVVIYIELPKIIGHFTYLCYYPREERLIAYFYR